MTNPHLEFWFFRKEVYSGFGVKSALDRTSVGALGKGVHSNEDEVGERRGACLIVGPVLGVMANFGVDSGSIGC
jgi:hypothetical protein